VRRAHHVETGSTNADALALIAAGERGWTMLTADRQTAGRGRRGREWVSPVGNLHASFVVPALGPGFAKPWQVGFAAALAIADVVAPRLEPGVFLRLKWPNDVTLNGAKVAGLLVEGSGALPALVVGIGVNVATAPDGTPYPATTLARHAASPVTAREVADALAVALPRRVAAFAEHGFAALRGEVVALSHRPGDPLSISSGADQARVSGRFLDIDAEGCLVLEVDGRARVFPAGDVFPLARV
jgi:BirA family biotin operon repressor/biotin-[acetyl-CoA-carboxylase] ligase